LKPGTYTVDIGIVEFVGSLQPRKHDITFRVSDGFPRQTDVTASASYSVNSVPTIAMVGQSGALSVPEAGTFENAITFSLVDTDGDPLTFQYGIDSAGTWSAYQEGITESSLKLTLSEKWPSPRLSKGGHTLYFRVTDGLSESTVVQLNVNVDGNDSQGSGGLSGGAIAGITIAVVVVVAAVIVAVFFFWRRQGKGVSEDNVDA
jgi:hypothetical protein